MKSYEVFLPHSSLLLAIDQDALQWASDDLKGDEEIVLKAVSHRWMALQWASEEAKVCQG